MIARSWQTRTWVTVSSARAISACESGWLGFGPAEGCADTAGLLAGVRQLARAGILFLAGSLLLAAPGAAKAEAPAIRSGAAPHTAGLASAEMNEANSDRGEGLIDERFRGVFAGWAIEHREEGISISTTIVSEEKRGSILLRCDAKGTAFHMTFEARRARRVTAQRRGIGYFGPLTQQADEIRAEAVPLTWTGNGEFRSDSWRAGIMGGPERVVELLTSHPDGIVVVAYELHPGRFIRPLRVRIEFLPDHDGQGYSRDAAFAALVDGCEADS